MYESTKLILGEPLKSVAVILSPVTFVMAVTFATMLDHTICAQITDSFLEFSLSQGNDLVTPRPEVEFGLVAGRWCLCISAEVHQAIAPFVYETHNQRHQGCTFANFKRLCHGFSVSDFY